MESGLMAAAFGREEPASTSIIASFFGNSSRSFQEKSRPEPRHKTVAADTLYQEGRRCFGK